MTPNSTQSAVPATDSSADASRRLFMIGAAIAFVGSLILYAKTMAASASFWDAGEFIASSHILGVPHSPGTPLYVLVAKSFSLVPLWFWTIAERMNFLSAFCGAVGILLAYMLIVRFLDFTLGKSDAMNDTMVKVAGALCGALFLAFSDTYWTNAVEAEVYAMSNAMMGFMTWLAIKWADNPQSKRSIFLIYLLFYLLALTVGFHLGTILAFSGIFFFILMTKDRTFTSLEFIVACLGVGIFIADATIYRNGQLTVFLLVVFLAVLVWIYTARSPFAIICSALFVIGLTVHFYLLIRAGHNPTINEGAPDNWRSLYAVLRREQYPSMNVLRRKADMLFQFQHFNGYFQAQFQMAATYVSQLNLGSILPIGLGIWGMVDQFSRHRRTFVMLFTTLMVVSVGLVIFLNFSDSEVRERDYFYSPAFYYFAIYIGIGAASLLNELKNLMSKGVDRSPSPVVVGACVVLIALPAFTLKHHYFTHDRSNNYTCPVYARNMLIGLEQGAILFTNGDNDTFPLWYIQEVEEYRKDIRVVNLSLLNTAWYIKQCRDLEPKVPIRWDDAAIDRLRPQPTESGWLLVRDLAVNHILRTNQFKRPVYFAVTIPPDTYAPYNEHLQMEGLAYKVLPTKGKNRVNLPVVIENVTKKFDYAGILTADGKRDRSLFLPRHTEHLIQNYAAAFIQLAYMSHADSSFDVALGYMETAFEIAPNMRQPLEYLGLYYLDAGDTVNAVGHYLRQIEESPQDLQLRYRLAGIHERTYQWNSALEQLDIIMQRDPNDRDIMMTAASIAARGGQGQRARNYLANWIQLHPKDQDVRKTLQDLERQLRGAPSSATGDTNQ